MVNLSDVRTKVSHNTSRSHSLKSTIPEGVVDALKIKHGDSVEWSLEAKDGKLIAIVVKAVKPDES